MPYKDKEKQRAWQRECKKRKYQILKNDAEYMEKKREQARKNKKKYAERYPERIKESNKKYYAKHKNRFIEYNKNYYLQNTKRVRELKKEIENLKKALKIEIHYACFYRKVLQVNGLLQATHKAMLDAEKIK